MLELISAISNLCSLYNIKRKRRLQYLISKNKIDLDDYREVLKACAKKGYLNYIKIIIGKYIKQRTTSVNIITNSYIETLKTVLLHSAVHNHFDIVCYIGNKLFLSIDNIKEVMNELLDRFERLYRISMLSNYNMPNCNNSKRLLTIYFFEELHIINQNIRTGTIRLPQELFVYIQKYLM